MDPLDESNTVPLTHASDSSYPPPEIVSNPPMSQPGAWMARDQRMTSQYPPGQRQPVSSSGMGTSTYSIYGPPRVRPATGAMPPSAVGSTGTISPQGVAPGIGTSRIVSPQGVAPGIGTSRIVSPQGVAPGISNAEIVSPQVAPPGIVSPQGIPPGIAPPRNIQRNGISANGLFMNAGDPSGYQATMSLSQPLPPRGNVNSSQAGLLKVQTQPMSNRSYVKTEQVRSAGYYCSSSNIDPALPGGLTNGALFPGDSTPSNVYRYQNKLNHGGLSQWTTAPPSPYSSGSSSTSSYDALHVQFSPTEVLTSPFASPRDSNDYNYGNSPNSVPLPRQPYSNNGQRSFTRPPPNFPQPYVDIPEIAPIGMVEELVPGMHHTSPLGSRTTAGLTHMWVDGAVHVTASTCTYRVHRGFSVSIVKRSDIGCALKSYAVEIRWVDSFMTSRRSCVEFKSTRKWSLFGHITSSAQGNESLLEKVNFSKTIVYMYILTCKFWQKHVCRNHV